MPYLLQADGQVRPLRSVSAGGETDLLTSIRRAWLSDRINVNAQTLAEQMAISVCAYRCILWRAQRMAGIPVQIVARNTGEPLDWHPLQAFTDHAADLFFLMDVSLSVWGRFYLRKQRNAYGYPSGLMWLNPLDVTVQQDGAGGIYGYLLAGGQEWVRPEDMVTFGLFDPLATHRLNGTTEPAALSPLEVALLSVGADRNIGNHIAAFFLNGTRVEGILSSPDATDDDVRVVARAFRQMFRGVRNFFKTLVLNGAWDYKRIASAPDELAMPELKKSLREDICAAFGVNPVCVGYGSAADALSAQSTMEQLERQFYQGDALPLFDRMVGALNSQWAWTDFEPVDTYTLKANRNALQILSFVTPEAGTIAQSLVNAQVLDPDEARAMLGRAPRAAGMLKVDPTRPTQVWQAGGCTLNEYRAMLGLDPTPLPVELVLVGGKLLPLDALPTIAQMNVTLTTSLPAAPSNGAGLASLPPETSAQTAPAIVHGSNGHRGPDGLLLNAPRIRTPEDAARVELRNWQRKVNKHGAQIDFICRALPPDTAAYTRLLLKTCGGLLTAAFEYARQDLARAAMRAYSNTALNLRATLLDLVARAFDETSLRATGLPLLSRQEFGRLGREEIDAASVQAYLDGQREGGGPGVLTEKDQERLTPHIKLQRQYFTGFANDIYNNMLPLYLKALASQEDAQMPDLTPEERDTLQRQALEQYAAFVAAHQAAEARAELYIFAGLEQIHQIGLLSAQGQQRKRFRLGNTEEHCATCLAADGQVHPAEAWLAAGIYPKSRRLLCAGFHCDCRFEDTNDEPVGDLAAIPLAGSRAGDDYGDPDEFAQTPIWEQPLADGNPATTGETE